MANAHRGEVDATLDGTVYRLCLTLGALAELEQAFGNDDMLSLAQRFTTGRVSAADATRIIGAGLRGAGHDVSDDAVTRMQSPSGVPGFLDIVVRLLTATFGVAPTVTNAASTSSTAGSAKAFDPHPTSTLGPSGAPVGPLPDPFHGTR
jgi:Phage tail tube protein, GTA-gp10